MSTISQSTSTRWIGYAGFLTEAPTSVSSPGKDTLAFIKLRQARARRRRIALGVLFSASLHVALFVGSNSKGNSTPVVAKARPPIEAFQIPVEEPKDIPDEPVELPVSTQIVDFAPPSLPDQLNVAVDSDFIITPTPPAPVNFQREGNLIRIPENVGRNTELSGKQVFSLAELDRQPELIQSINPTYPPELTNARIHGTVVVHFIVNSRGDIVNSEVVSTPHPLLGSAVTKALSKWKFRAGMKGGRAVNTDMELPVRFNVE